MVSFTVTTFINRPTQEVFDFVTNPANAAQWKIDMVSSKYTSEGPVGVGSTFQNVGQMLGRKIVADGEITQWNPPNVWGYKATNGPAKLEETNKFESKDGGTLLIQSFQVEVGGFFKMAEGLAVKQMQKQLETHANTLKMLLEAK
jgi:ligand-binding SRPBCC domain-containing protein